MIWNISRQGQNKDNNFFNIFYFWHKVMPDEFCNRCTPSSLLWPFLDCSMSPYSIWTVTNSNLNPYATRKCSTLCLEKIPIKLKWLCQFQARSFPRGIWAELVFLFFCGASGRLWKPDSGPKTRSDLLFFIIRHAELQFQKANRTANTTRYNQLQVLESLYLILA